MKRIICIISAVIFTTTVLIGCGDSQTVQEDSNIIKVWANMRSDEVEGLQKLADKWSAENNNQKVQIIEVTTDAKQFIEVPARPDALLGASAEETQVLSKAEAIDKVPDNLISKDNYVTSDLAQSTTVDGIQYGIPMTQETVSLFYNKDKVDSVPKTMEELAEIAKDKGFSFELNNYYFSFGFVASQGGYTFKNNNGSFDYNDLGVNNEGAIKGYKFLQDLVVKDNLFLGGATDMMSSGQFAKGEIAFYIGETGRVRTFKEAGVNFGVAAIPTVNGKTVTPFKFVKMGCVNSKSDKKDATWSLIKYLSSGSDKIFMKTGPYPPVFKKSLESDTFKNDEYVQALYKQACNSIILPNIIQAKAIDLSTNTQLNRLALGEITPEECGQNIEKEIKQAITQVLTY